MTVTRAPTSASAPHAHTPMSPLELRRLVHLCQATQHTGHPELETWHYYHEELHPKVFVRVVSGVRDPEDHVFRFCIKGTDFTDFASGIKKIKEVQRHKKAGTIPPPTTLPPPSEAYGWNIDPSLSGGGPGASSSSSSSSDGAGASTPPPAPDKPLGLEGATHLVTDLSFSLVPFDMREPRGAKAHSGFLAAARAMVPTLYEHLSRLPPHLLRQITVIELVGHSMGGTIGWLLACLIKQQPPQHPDMDILHKVFRHGRIPLLRSVSFGAPHAGDRAMNVLIRRAFQGRIERVLVDMDPVPRLCSGLRAFGYWYEPPVPARNLTPAAALGPTIAKAMTATFANEKKGPLGGFFSFTFDHHHLEHSYNRAFDRYLPPDAAANVTQPAVGVVGDRSGVALAQPPASGFVGAMNFVANVVRAYQVAKYGYREDGSVGEMVTTSM